MTTALLVLAGGLIVGMPLILFGVMRLDERGGWTGWAVLVLGLCVLFGPIAVAVTAHQDTAGQGRYSGR